MNQIFRTAASHRDHLCCGLSFLGQNLFYLLVYMYLNTYLTDAGIPALAVAAIALTVRLWDAFDDPFLGRLMMRLRCHRNCTLWNMLVLAAVPLTTLLLFSIPHDLPTAGKILWAAGAYLLWDNAFSLCTAPLFGLEGSVRQMAHGHAVLSALGRVFAMAASIILVVLIPSFRASLGGWQACAALIAGFSLLSMLPARLSRGAASGCPDQPVSVRRILRYLRGNRYLTVYYLAFMVVGALNIGSCWGLYLARHCLHNEALLSVTGLLTMVPGIVVGAFLPAFTRHADKYRLLHYAVIAALAAQLVRFLVGYHNTAAYLTMTVLAAIPMGVTMALLFRVTPDCIEYGRYTGQDDDPALPFATQIFFIKLQSAAMVAVGSVVLAAIGFVEGEGALQAPGFADRLWSAGILLPAAGLIAGLLVLRRYHLSDHDVALMRMCNDGSISREEARRQLCHVCATR